MRDTFLSIDLDFWDCIYFEGSEKHDYEKWSQRHLDKIRTFQNIIKSGIYCEWFVEHDHMVPFINQTNSVVIINKDFHSDLSGPDKNTGMPEPLNEGNVFDHVSDSLNKTYIWMYPYAHLGKPYSMGRCDGGEDIFRRSRWIYRKQTRTCDWRINFDKIEAIGICLSPKWINNGGYYFVRDLEHFFENHPGFNESMEKLKQSGEFNEK